MSKVRNRFFVYLTFGLLFDFALLATIYFKLPDVSKLNKGTVLERTSGDGKKFFFVAGPRNKNYVNLQALPRVLWLSVLELEDGKFFQHNGFDIEEIQNAVWDSLEQGKRLRGASTLSQQLVKNLYLSPSRTFKRKLLEALITIKLELILPKRKILEVYLNSIDWGRGLFGISEASQFYFKKRPSELSIRESVFLAAIIPNPSRFGKLAEDQLPKKFVRVQMLRALDSLFHMGEIKLEEYQKVMTAPYEFKTPYEFAPPTALTDELKDD